jgi:hypothetical protein
MTRDPLRPAGLPAPVAILSLKHQEVTQSGLAVSIFTPLALLPTRHHPMLRRLSCVARTCGRLRRSKLWMIMVAVITCPPHSIPDLCHVAVVLNIHTPPPPLWPNQGQNNQVRIHTGHENTNHPAIIIAFYVLTVMQFGRQRESLPSGRLDS